jgi:hypothetical protein
VLAPIEDSQMPAVALLGALFFAEAPGWSLLRGSLVTLGVRLSIARSAGR